MKRNWEFISQKEIEERYSPCGKRQQPEGHKHALLAGFKECTDGKWRNASEEVMGMQ